MAHDVFISFKSEDREFAEKICDDLASKGIKCWISSRDIRGGQNFQEEIAKAVVDTTIMVLVFSAAADKSDEIGKELSIASKYKKLVIPVRIEDFLPGFKFMYEMSNRQYIDLFKKWEEGIEKIASDVKHFMSTKEMQPISVNQVETNEKKDVYTFNESKYLEIFEFAFEDGIISNEEKIKLEDKKIQWGISPERALYLEDKIKQQSNASKKNIVEPVLVGSENAKNTEPNYDETPPVQKQDDINAQPKANVVPTDFQIFALKAVFEDGDEKFEGDFIKDLQNGIARFGWSYIDNADLYLLKEKIDKNGWKSLTVDEQGCWVANFLLEVKEGDYLVYINMPEWGKCTIVEAIGGYLWAPWSYGDFRHSIPISKKIRIFDRNASFVHPDLSTRLKLMGKYWRIYLKDKFEDLLKTLDQMQK